MLSGRGKSHLIAVAMSGGVDSTVAAVLLKERGHEIIGVHMTNWDELDETGHCQADKDFQTVQRVCDKIRIQCVHVNFVKEYWNVFSQILDNYSSGLTPNPDILCNCEIKIQALHNYCRSQLGAAAMATGHYACLSREWRPEFADEDRDTTEPVKLLCGTDPSRDQTYFLAAVPQAPLRRTIFPVGNLLKSAVREIACRAGFADVADQPEVNFRPRSSLEMSKSQGLCFVGKRKFSDFIRQYIPPRPGDIETLDGRCIGHHQGLHFYTVGQRSKVVGLSEAAYVVRCDAARNVVVVANGSSDALFTHKFTTLEPHWISGSPPEELTDGTLCCFLKCRYPRSHFQLLPDLMMLKHGTVNMVRSSGLVVTSSFKLRAVAPGQFAVFYHGNECLGCAVISSTVDET